MVPRRYPAWEAPEIGDWRDAYPPAGYYPRCFPLFAIGTVGLVGAFAFCFPRRAGCHPFLSCTPTFICQPRRACIPYGGF